MKTYDRGTAIYLKATLKDVTGALVDPTSVTVSITDSAGTAKVTDQAMTKVLLGEYFYVWQSAEADPAGGCTVKIKAVKDGYTSINKSVPFGLE